MQPHQQRVVEELADLEEKLSKLSKFMASDFFNTVDAFERERLRFQRDVMQLYADALRTRINNF